MIRPPLPPHAEPRSRRTRPRNVARPLVALLLAALVAQHPAPVSAQAGADRAPAVMDLASFPRSALTLHTAAGQGHVFRGWIADTPERQQQGLMFVRDLPADEGMLFVNRQPRPSGMWMKNTYIALDMLFIDPRGRIVRIFERTVPHSLEVLEHDGPVKAVLELRGGEVLRRGIRIGDRVDHPAFRNGRGGGAL
jgi:uncharacterized membrane protein (UPF0127 family)